MMGCALTSAPAKAFDWRQCSQVKDKAGVVLFSTSFATSTSSSSGPCSLFQEARDQRLNYISSSANQILGDLAKGEGEYLQTLLALYPSSTGAAADSTSTVVIAKLRRSEFSLLLRQQQIERADQVLGQLIEVDAF